MKRIIVIDCCAANILFNPSESLLPADTRTVVSGRLIPAAMLLASAGRDVTVMGEAGRDPLGDLVVACLDHASADTSCIDRYSGVPTPCNLVFSGAEGLESVRASVYHITSTEQWDSKWPRIDSSDAVLFGGYFSLQPRVRGRLTEFLGLARDRGATVVYMPGYNPSLEPTITRVMPALLENLEAADAVITSSADLAHIFGDSDARRCYERKISFYSPLMVNVDPTLRSMSLMKGDITVERPLPASPSVDGVLPSPLQPALFIDALQQLGVTPKNIDSLPRPVLDSIADITSQASLTSYITL